MTGRLIRLFLIVASGLCVAIFLFASSSALGAIVPVRITDNTINDGRPDVRGNTIVWKRLSSVSGWDIFTYDMSDPGEQIISNASGSQINPMTNGIIAVWEDWTSGDSDVFMRDTLLGISTQPLVTGPGNQAILSVSGNRLVYVNNTSPAPCLPGYPSYPNCPGTGENDINNNIYAVDLDNPNHPYPVSTAAGSQWQPRISGNTVVWQDYRDGNWDIWMKDLSGGSEWQVTTDPANDQVADISGDTIVWRSSRNGRYDIWMKKLPSGPELPVTSDAAFQNTPRISGDLVVWEDYRNDANPGDTYYDYDIYMNDITSGVESMLAGGTPIQAHAAVNRETVVWDETTPGGSTDVWMATVPDTTAPLFDTPNPADGTAWGCSSLNIGAEYSDNRAGIDTDSVQLTVDGQDVTSSTTVTDASAYYQSDAMVDGLHTASLTVSDLSGNSASISWTFTSSRPALNLNSLSSYWDSYTDFLNRELSVQYQITNSSGYADANDLLIYDSQATAGVIMSSPSPINIEGLSPGSQSDVVIKYLVPNGVGSFKVTLYAGCYDTCGGAYFFPGPPPGW